MKKSSSYKKSKIPVKKVYAERRCSYYSKIRYNFYTNTDPSPRY
jgi:hypothetical protein